MVDEPWKKGHAPLDDRSRGGANTLCSVREPTGAGLVCCDGDDSDNTVPDAGQLFAAAEKLSHIPRYGTLLVLYRTSI